MTQPYLAVVTPLANSGLLIVPVNTAAHPEHPIAPGGRPPGIWGGGNEPFPTPPIAPGGPPPSVWPSPGHPAHPIVLPPNTIWPDPGPLPHPEHPIVIPPESEVPPDEKPPTGPGLFEWHTVWTEQEGWVVVGVPQGAHPVPSKK